MTVSRKNLPKSQVALNIELTPDEVEIHRQAALQSLGKNLKVEGFRAGHVPDKLVAERVGETQVFAQMAELAVRKTYQEALGQESIDALGEPQVEVLKLAPGNPLEFRITVAVVPEVELPDYKKIAASSARKPVAVEEKEVQEALDWLKNSRKAEEGKPLEDSDDFAKTVGNFETLDTLKESIKEGLQHEKETQETDRLRQEILENIAEKSHMDVPEVLVEREKQVLLQNIKQGVAQMMQVSFEDYLKQTGKTEQEVLDSFQEEAEKRVKRFLVIRKVAEQEAIAPAKEEIEEEANKILSHYKQANRAEKDLDPARLQEYTEGVLKHEKTLQFLEGFAT